VTASGVSPRRGARSAIGLTIAVALLTTSATRAQSPTEPDVAAQDNTQVSRLAAARPGGWQGALQDSIRLLAFEHAVRIGFQSKTRRELPGPFWSDYRRSLNVPHQWSDGDGWFVNYIGHPIHGAAAGRIWLDHTPLDRDPPFGTAAYWKSRAIASAWATGYSIQFEFGPLSEASIGNVGLYPPTRGWVDHVITPVGSMAMTVAEDALDRFVMLKIERQTRNRVVRASMRVFLNPSRAIANGIQGHLPWYRHDRSLR